MAFVKEALFCVSSPTGDSPRIFSYGTTDSISTVLAGGYFNASYQVFRRGDLIKVVADADQKEIVITAANASSVTTAISSNTEPRYRKYVRQASDFDSPIDSTIEYFVDGNVDMGSASIEVPAAGLYIHGYNFDTSKLTSSENSYTMFTSPAGGSGNIIWHDIGVEVTGTSSAVFDLTSDTGNEAIELSRCNFNNCTSLGEITNYRQVLESGNGRFGGTPELTLSGAMNGYRITESIVRSLSNISALFKEGTSLLFSGRFVSDVNCNLPATGALLDFSPSNFTNDESLVLQGAYITRGGTIDATDTTICPNIDQDSVKSIWKNNTGLPNTTKHINATCTAEVATTVAAPSTYYPLLGTFTVDRSSHIDMPSNGQFRVLSGYGTFAIRGDLAIVGTANDEIDIRVTKSTDDGSTWPTVVRHMKREINSFVGSRDVAFFPVDFLTEAGEGDRFRLEVENKSAARNVTMELDSHFIMTGI